MPTVADTLALLDGPLADAPMRIRLTVLNHLPHDVAHPLLAAMVQDGSWNKVKLEWFSSTYLTSQSAPDPVAAEAEMFAQMLRSMTGQPLTADFPAVFSHIRNGFFRLERKLGDAFPWRDVEVWVASLLSQIGPGDAGNVAHVATTMLESSNAHPRWAVTMLPLAEWLLKHGAAELRRRGRALACWLLARIAFENQRDDLVPLALRYLLSNGDGLQCLNQYRYGPAWQLAEAALAQPHVSPGLAVDFALARLRAGQEPFSSVLEPLSTETYARCRAALLDALLKGEFDGPLQGRPAAQAQSDHAMEFNPPHHLVEVWKALFSSKPPAVLTFRSPRTVGLALGAVNRMDADARYGDLSEIYPSWNEWLALIVTDFLRLHRVLDEGATLPAQRTLSLLVGHNGTWKGTSIAVTQALRRNERTTLLHNSLALLDFWPEPDWHQTISISNALPRAEVHAQTTSDAGTYWQTQMPRVRAELLLLLSRHWDQPLGGVEVEAMVRGIHDIQFGQLDDPEDKVQEKDGVLWVESSYVRDQINKPRLTDSMLAVCLLYVVHEWIHISQEIGKKSTVSALRATGAEATLMHFDLGADHAAALIVEALRPEWSVTWLKNVQGRSLADFPATSQHTAAARSRKSNRLVALRLDVLVREAMPAVVGGLTGFVFSEYSPGSGAFLVLESGPPMRVLHLANATPAQVGVLDAGADAQDRPEDGLLKVDAVLRTLLAQREK
jgi:hypothetical protein